MGLLEGKVALVTGAGGGLGRAYAHLFAKEGAKVVVNDLGGARDGAGSSEKMADTVVNEIKEAGGEAVANYGSVAEADDAQAMVQQAIDEWGKLDIVVNNAGILRDKTLVKMTEEMWDLVIKVHLKGTYLVTHAAVKAMSADGGRIINTSSLAGLKGNFGQSNYGAAKAGIAGFTRVVALETRKMGITVNAIAPVAKTRMTDDIDMVPDEFEPEDIAPLVCWLASDEAENVTGRIFGAHGSHFFEYLTETTPGVDLGKDERWTPQMVGEKFEKITEVPKPAATGAEAGGPIDTVRALFEGLPATFKAEKASGWKANIVFEIGGTPMSLVVKDDAAEFKNEAVGSPSAKVTFDGPQTVLAMAKGELAPEQAFMSGKVKTDNMGALMKFGKFFDLAAAAAALPADAGAGNKVETLFEALPETFKADKAGEWGARIVFDIGGAEAHSLIIESASVTYESGTVDSPTGKVTFDSQTTILDMALGKLAPEQAFMSGKVKTDNMGVLMKFGQYFDLEAAASELGSGGGSAKKGLNYDAEGKKYRGKAKFVHEEDTIRYARATDDDNEHYVDTSRKGGIVAPPLFPVKPLFEVLTQAIADDELNADLLRLVHGEQDMRFHRHLKPWDLAAARAEISSIEQKSSGDLIEVHQWLMVDGEMTTEARSGLFIRGEGGGGGGKTKEKPEEPERDIIFEEKQVVAEDQPKRYADASDDHNPIHVDPEVAKSAGLPSVILHGLCTMAFAGRAVVNGPCEGDPHRLKRLKVRFSKPVLPGWELTTRIWKEDDGVLGLEVVNQDGVKVITNGLAEVMF